MSTGNDRKSIDQEIDHVRECIERCMQMYMNKRETVNFLATQGNIQAAVTRLVWARLERDNPEFFRAYYVMLAVQEQIIEFNKLLPAQVELMRRIALTGNTSVFNYSLPQATQYRNVDLQESRHLKPENMRQVYVINNYGPSIQGNLDRPFQIRETNDVYPNMLLPQYHPNAGLEQTENAQIFGGGRSDLSFVARGNLMHHHQLNSAAAEYPVDYSSGSSGLSLPSNAAPHYLDNFLFNIGFEINKYSSRDMLSSPDFDEEAREDDLTRDTRSDRTEASIAQDLAPRSLAEPRQLDVNQGHV
ncbi:Plant protein 1589 of unknown function [Striga hermonthica]|uniref:Uncharacterized protein n=1 Tax=Striga hermonthica TaxID=68872 RepID=A0A9N7N712_STRHE|nr:Plant protein 1589 of unknown function [Striga hermonthica]